MPRKKATKRGPSKVEREFATIFDELWKDPKYVALHARKDRLLREWNIADAYKNTPHGSKAKAARLDAIVKRVLRRLYAYEERMRAKLQKAGAL